VIAQRLFANTPNAVTQARRYVLELLDDLDPEALAEAEVMVSELATNSLRHAASHFIVCVERFPEEIKISVEDTGPGYPELRTPDPAASAGRGLQIVAALASRWGVTPRFDGPGKKVWFTMRASEPGGRLREQDASDAAAPRRSSRGEAPQRSTDTRPGFHARARAAA
jgi:anti-sigma regulatory factor (Ser/Thr protein kinase)